MCAQYFNFVDAMNNKHSRKIMKSSDKTEDANERNVSSSFKIRCSSNLFSLKTSFKLIVFWSFACRQINWTSHQTCHHTWRRKQNQLAVLIVVKLKHKAKSLSCFIVYLQRPYLVRHTVCGSSKFRSVCPKLEHSQTIVNHNLYPIRLTTFLLSSKNASNFYRCRL